MTEYNQACPCCGAGGVSEERERDLQALLRRDWAVRVLDAWADEPAIGTGSRFWENQRKGVLLQDGQSYVMYRGATRDDARHAAALAALSQLGALGLGQRREHP